MGVIYLVSDNREGAMGVILLNSCSWVTPHPRAPVVAVCPVQLLTADKTVAEWSAD